MVPTHSKSPTTLVWCIVTSLAVRPPPFRNQPVWPSYPARPRVRIQISTSLRFQGGRLLKLSEQRVSKKTQRAFCWESATELGIEPMADDDPILELPCKHSFCQFHVHKLFERTLQVGGETVWCCNPSDVDLFLAFAERLEAAKYICRSQKLNRLYTTFCYNSSCGAIFGFPDTADTICLVCHKCRQQNCTNYKQLGHGGRC